MPKLAKVRWLDNCYREGSRSLDDLGTGAELTYYGVLVKETEIAVTLALEVPSDGFTRNPFDILRRNILELEIMDAKKAFPKRRPKKDEKPKKAGGEDSPDKVALDPKPGTKPGPGPDV
jgi:hypothetical protein